MFDTLVRKQLSELGRTIIDSVSIGVATVMEDGE